MEDGNFAAICDAYFLKDLRSDSKFLEVSRYPGYCPVSALHSPSSSMQPPQIPFNSVWSQGLMQGQAINMDMMGQQLFPTGFVFDGIRWFVSTNLPTASVSLNYTNAINPALNGMQTRRASLGIIFGAECIGIGMGGAGPEVLLNNNDDFNRFVIAIWRLFGAWELLDERFVTCARSFQN